MTQAPATPSFGDIVENGWASEENPTRKGYFVRSFKRIGRMNPGLTWVVTDRAGKFWELQPRVVGDRLSVTPYQDALEASQALADRYEKALREIANYGEGVQGIAMARIVAAEALAALQAEEAHPRTEGRGEGVIQDSQTTKPVAWAYEYTNHLLDRDRAPGGWLRAVAFEPPTTARVRAGFVRNVRPLGPIREPEISSSGPMFILPGEDPVEYMALLRQKAAEMDREVFQEELAEAMFKVDEKHGPFRLNVPFSALKSFQRKQYERYAEAVADAILNLAPVGGADALADALHAEGPTECAYRLAGRWLYERIDCLIDAKPNSVEAAELDYLAKVAEALEQHGYDAWPPGTQPVFPPVGGRGEGWRPTHRHLKRGTDYQVIGEGWLQTASIIGTAADDENVTIYRGDDGRLWVRPTAEFNDGRFEPLPPPPQEQGGMK